MVGRITLEKLTLHRQVSELLNFLPLLIIHANGSQAPCHPFEEDLPVFKP